ncbi:hypothetical protein ACPCC5_27315 [Streptomyces pseudogriseolus]|uniref:hypothetical protein n=1 Tax=Streptomyces pseudogriseolus TaxID=36817 RepID=UPI003FA25079
MSPAFPTPRRNCNWLCFHHAVLDAQDDLVDAITRLRELTQSGDYACHVEIAHFMAGLAITRLRELTQSGDYACHVEIAHFMAGLPLPEHTAQARWIDGRRSTARGTPARFSTAARAPPRRLIAERRSRDHW